MSLTLARDPVIEGRMAFTSASDAEGFVARWPNIVRENGTELMLAGLRGPFRDAEWELDDNEAVFRMTIPNATMNRLAASLSMLRAR